ncbi:11S globulin-like protein [Striga asiatica]|uniref:11S globulin-like protein n=1 Tax=Striga asiatica TaxID=4170 RepID=A0A5A7PF64_STRAF|nr:11S globulin-like protein [Striga asiatica]
MLLGEESEVEARNIEKEKSRSEGRLIRNEELVLVVFHDNGNNANQLDQNPRSFFLARNPTRGQQQEQHIGQGRPHVGNVFRGFGIETIAEVFKVSEETARKLQGKNDERGHIVTGDEGLQVIRPPSEYSRREREEEERYYGGLERV